MCIPKFMNNNKRHCTWKSGQVKIWLTGPVALPLNIETRSLKLLYSTVWQAACPSFKKKNRQQLCTANFLWFLTVQEILRVTLVECAIHKSMHWNNWHLIRDNNTSRWSNGLLRWELVDKVQATGLASDMAVVLSMLTTASACSCLVTGMSQWLGERLKWPSSQHVCNRKYS